MEWFLGHADPAIIKKRVDSHINQRFEKSYTSVFFFLIREHNIDHAVNLQKNGASTLKRLETL